MVDWSSRGTRVKQEAAEQGVWEPLVPAVTGFEHRLTIPQWNLHEDAYAECYDKALLER